jgi:hypothetical protein
MGQEMKNYLVVNKTTQEVYAQIDAQNLVDLRHEWARRCGCEDWNDLLSKASISMDDVQVYVTIQNDNAESSTQPKELCSIAQNSIESWFFVALLHGSTYAFWFLEDNGVVVDRGFSVDGRGEYTVEKSAYRAWDDVPECLKKALVDKIERLKSLS